MSTSTLQSRTYPEIVFNNPSTEKFESKRVAATTRDGFVPTDLVKSYVSAALRRTLVERTEDGKYFLSIPALGDVWAMGTTFDEAEKSLSEIVKQWVQMKIEDQDDDIPVIDTIDLNWL
ncbi:MAG: type II toxin-antitoxin system HicB family antitoxin [Candidatus Nanopelagicaceae bacterium]|nr:type II toxin-antitoxin system HicB family antitoxin [Candidatus Nanopelagicaceae bacterium]